MKFIGLSNLVIFTILSLSITAVALDETELAVTAINCVICRVANLVFMIAGAVASLVLIVAGLRWVISGEDAGARNAAKSTIINVFIGLLIIMTAVYVVHLVIVDLLPGVDPALWMDPQGGCNKLCKPLVNAMEGDDTGVDSSAQDEKKGTAKNTGGSDDESGDPDSGPGPTEIVLPSEAIHSDEIVEVSPPI